MLASIKEGLYKQRHLLVYGLGSCVVIVWTLLRFFTQRTIFDLISQQVVVHQWLHSAMSTTHLGQTAYVPKMLLLYAPLDELPGSPRLKLILITLIINVLTFVLLGILLEKILQIYRVHIGWSFYAALLWFSAIIGSVFWIEFANSRNLEVVGGIFWLYLGLRYLRQQTQRRLWSLLTLGSLLFFGDPLQLYMSALPLLVYAFILAATKKQARKPVIELLGATIAAYVVAKVLFIATGHWLHLSFTDTGKINTPQLTVSWLKNSVEGSAKAILSLFSGAADAGRLREIINLGLLLAGLAAILYTLRQRLVPRQLLVLVGSIVCVDIIVYIASGQAVQGAATSRYLIMLAPALVLCLSTIRLPKNVYQLAGAIAVVVIGLNVILLSLVLARNWNTSFPKDTHIESVYRYKLAHPKEHIYGSTDTAMPLLYLHNLIADKALPVGCLNGAVVRTHFSMDAAFTKNTAETNKTAAIVLDGATITNTPNSCSVDSITRELGQPLRLSHTDDGSLVMLYGQADIQLPN